MKNKLYLAIFPLVLIVLFSPSMAAYGISSTPQYYTKDSSPYGIPYADWIKKWWQWSVSVPKAEHPQTLNSKVMCATKVSGQVSFIVHSIQGSSHYTCTIPAKNAIMVPIATATCTSIEEHTTNPAVLMDCTTQGHKHLTIKDVILDGVRLSGLEGSWPLNNNDFGSNYAKTNIFEMTIPNDNFELLKSGTYPTAGSGYFVFLKPLPSGEHNLKISAYVINPIDPSFNFNYDTSIDLKAK